MQNFLKIAQKQLKTIPEYEQDIGIYPPVEDPNMAVRRLHEQILVLEERNRHLEAKIARLLDMLNGGGNQLVLRENACDEKENLVERKARVLHSAIEKLSKQKQEMKQALLKSYEDVQAAKEGYQRELEKIKIITKQLKEKDREIEKLQQAIYRLSQEKQQLEQILCTREHRLREFSLGIENDYVEEGIQGRGYMSSFADSLEKEEYAVNSLPQTKNNGRHGTLTEKPFGYTDLNRGIYLKGSQQIDRSEMRVSMLEEKVEHLSEEISEMKRMLEYISKNISSPKEAISKDIVIDDLERFLEEN